MAILNLSVLPLNDDLKSQEVRDTVYREQVLRWHAAGDKPLERVREAVANLAALAEESGCHRAIINGSGRLTSLLARALREIGVTPYFSLPNGRLMEAFRL